MTEVKGLELDPQTLEGRYGPFPEAGKEGEEYLKWLAETFSREDQLVASERGLKLQFEGEHLPAALGEMPKAEIEMFSKGDAAWVGKWREFYETYDRRPYTPPTNPHLIDPKFTSVDDLTKLLPIPDTWRLITDDIRRLNDHGIPLELRDFFVVRHIAEWGGFDRTNQDWHIDPLSYLISLPGIGIDDSVDHTTQFQIGEGTMSPIDTESKTGALVFINSPRGVNNGEIFSSPSGLIVRKPNFVAHRSPPVPSIPQYPDPDNPRTRTLIQVRTRRVTPPRELVTKAFTGRYRRAQ